MVWMLGEFNRQLTISLSDNIEPRSREHLYGFRPDISGRDSVRATSQRVCCVSITEYSLLLRLDNIHLLESLRINIAHHITTPKTPKPAITHKRGAFAPNK